MDIGILKRKHNLYIFTIITFLLLNIKFIVVRSLFIAFNLIGFHTTVCL